MTDSEPVKKASWHENLSVIRWIFAIFGILIMLFSGGCSLFFLGNYLLTPKGAGGYDYLIFMGIAAGLVVLLIGFGIWKLAAKAGRNKLNQ